MRIAQARKQKRVKTWEDWALIGVVATSALMMLCAFGLRMTGTPAEHAQNELRTLADDYYVEYLYPRLLGDLNADPKEKLEKYQEGGVATTYLRQLLHYNDNEHIASAEVFEMVKCDTNSTSVRYFPMEPYGPRDYKVRYSTRCETGDLSF